MEEIKKLEKTIDIDALFRWGLRKWRGGLLIFFIAVLFGGGLVTIRQTRQIRQETEKTLVMTEEEKETVDEYLKYDIYIEEMADIIDLLEEDIYGDMEEIADEKSVVGETLNLSEKMKILETYNTYYNNIVAKRNGLQGGFNDAQKAYVNEIKGEEGGESNEKEEMFLRIKRGIKIGVKYGTMFGILTVGVWGFVLMLIFGLNGKIKSKEDILAICGDLTIIEGKRSFIKKGKVQIVENLGIGAFLAKEDPNIVNLAEKVIFDVDNWNDRLTQNSGKEIKKEERVILITEIGVSSYSDIIKAKEEYGESVIGCLCIR